MLRSAKNWNWSGESKLDHLESVQSVAPAAGNVLFVKYPDTMASKGKESLEKWSRTMTDFLGIPIIIIPACLDLNLLKLEGFDADTFRERAKVIEEDKEKAYESARRAWGGKEPIWTPGEKLDKAKEAIIPEEEKRTTFEYLAEKFAKREAAKITVSGSDEIIPVGTPAISEIIRAEASKAISKRLDEIAAEGTEDGFERSSEEADILPEDEKLGYDEVSDEEISGRARKASDHARLKGISAKESRRHKSLRREGAKGVVADVARFLASHEKKGR